MDSSGTVNAWFLNKWTSGADGFTPRYRSFVYGEPEELEVITTDALWDCDCYSSWTRDDNEVLEARIKTRNGRTTVTYGTWHDFPDFLQEILDFGHLEDFCEYENSQE